jgi:hypothetical protein
MTTTIRQFDVKSLRQIERDHERLRVQMQNLQRMLGAAFAGTGEREETILAVASEAIPAVDAGVVSSGSASVRRIVRDGGNIVLEAQSFGLSSGNPLLNVGDVEIEAGDLMIAQRLTQGGWWVAQKFEGENGDSETGRKPLVRFTLDADIDFDDASAAATITNQYGPGDAAGDTNITVHNLETDDAGVYEWEGKSGDAGLALFDADQNYRIIYLRRAADPPRKSLVRFTLDGSLSITNASAAATITNQYGPGVDAPNTSITVHNLLTSTAGEYVFSGSIASAGLAMWDADQDYRIIQMECP